MCGKASLFCFPCLGLPECYFLILLRFQTDRSGIMSQLSTDLRDLVELNSFCIYAFGIPMTMVSIQLIDYFALGLFVLQFPMYTFHWIWLTCVDSIKSFQNVRNQIANPILRIIIMYIKLMAICHSLQNAM